MHVCGIESVECVCVTLNYFIPPPVSQWTNSSSTVSTS